MHFDYFTVKDGTCLRYGIWPVDSGHFRGRVILLSGRTEFMEKYSESIDELVSRGFDVLSMDWRGQGLSERPLPNRYKGFVERFEDYLSDLEDFMHRIVMPRKPAPSIIMAHSMGAHIAMRFLHDYTGPLRIDRAVLTSPMVDIFTTPFPYPLARLMTRIAVKAGKKTLYAPGFNDEIPGGTDFKAANPLTSDPERFLQGMEAIKKNPDLAIGGVTYGWLDAAFNSIDMLNAPGYTERIRVPILIVCAGNDQVVPLARQKALANRLPDCRIRVIPEARHEILKEVDAVRDVFWNEFDRFTALETADTV